MRVRRGPATVTEYCAREPGTAPPAAATRDEDPEEGPTHAPRTAPGAVPVILLLSTSDTDLLSARASGAAWRPANPNRVTDLPALLDGADVVVVRILGGRRDWEEGIDTVLASGKPVVALGGEQAPDAEMMELSTVPAGVAAQAHAYLAQGGPANLAQLHAFLSDTVLLTGEGFAPPVELPSWGILDRDPVRTDGPTVAVLYYRAHQLAGNTAFVEALCTADRGRRRPGPSRVLRVAAAGRARAAADAACGGRAWSSPCSPRAARSRRARRRAATTRPGTSRELAALDVPILQGLCLTSSRDTWAGSDDGLSPLDAATQVAVPEFDGRLITVPFSFKEFDADGLSVYVRRPRARRPRRRHRRAPRPAAAHPERGQADRADAVGVPDQARPDRQRRRPRHPGVRGRAAAVAWPRPATPSDKDGAGFPGVAEQDGDALIHALIEAGGQDPDWLTEEQLAGNPIRISAATLRALVRHAARRLPQGRRGALGSGARRAVRRPDDATSSSPPCAAATSC